MTKVPEVARHQLGFWGDLDGNNIRPYFGQVLRPKAGGEGRGGEGRAGEGREGEGYISICYAPCVHVSATWVQLTPSTARVLICSLLAVGSQGSRVSMR